MGEAVGRIAVHIGARIAAEAAAHLEHGVGSRGGVGAELSAAGQSNAQGRGGRVAGVFGPGGAGTASPPPPPPPGTGFALSVSPAPAVGGPPPPRGRGPPPR